MISRLFHRLEQHPASRKLLEDPVFRALTASSLSMGWNLIYALFNAVLGKAMHSRWFMVMAGYYLILGIMRLYTVAHGSRKGCVPERTRRAVRRRLGYGMLILAVMISCVMYVAINEKHNPQYHSIIMITIAAFTFYLIILSIINSVKALRKKEDTLILLRNISLASTAGSILSLERAMLGTFGDAADSFTFVMETATGAGVFLFLAEMGILIIRHAGK